MVTRDAQLLIGVVAPSVPLFGRGPLIAMTEPLKSPAN